MVDVELADDEAQLSSPAWPARSSSSLTGRKTRSPSPPAPYSRTTRPTSPAHYVYLAKADKDGKYPRRTVKIGKTAAGKTEILEGLSRR